MKQYREIVESILDKLPNIDVTVEHGQPKPNGITYIIKQPELKMTITLSDKWVGFELDIPKDVLGRQIGFGEDTDNYALGDGNEKITQAIFDDLIECLNNVISGDIYIGKNGKKAVLAFPHGKQYKVLMASRFFMRKDILEEKEFALLELRRVKV